MNPGWNGCLQSVVALLLSVAAASAAAQGLEVKDAWARATVPGQKTGAVYMDVASERDAAIVAAESAAADRVELHLMTMDGGVMRMRAVQKIDVPAGKPVKLAPGGLHIMLIGVKQPLKPGDKVPLLLRVEESGGRKSTHNVEAVVRAADGAKAHAHH